MTTADRQLNEGTAIEATNRPLRSADSDSKHDKKELVLQLYALTATGRMLAETIYALQELVSSQIDSAPDERRSLTYRIREPCRR